MKECLDCKCDEYNDYRCCSGCDRICKGSCEFIKNGNDVENCACVIDKK